MKTTKTATCKQALDETSELRPFGRQWKFAQYDTHCRAWRESTPTDYFRARTARRRRLIERAREILHPDMEDGHQHEPGDLEGGKWQSYV
jgi:hypothetical protein